jgi:hypothetical protein
MGLFIIPDRHFENVDINSVCTCPIARTLRDLFPGKTITVFYTDVTVGGISYKLVGGTQRKLMDMENRTIPRQVEIIGLDNPASPNNKGTFDYIVASPGKVTTYTGFNKLLDDAEFVAIVAVEDSIEVFRVPSLSMPDGLRAYLNDMGESFKVIGVYSK